MRSLLIFVLLTASPVNTDFERTPKERAEQAREEWVTLEAREAELKTDVATSTDFERVAQAILQWTRKEWDKLKARGDKLSARAHKLKARGDKLNAEWDKLSARAHKSEAEWPKLVAERDKLVAELDELKADWVRFEAAWTLRYMINGFLWFVLIDSRDAGNIVEGRQTGFPEFSGSWFRESGKDNMGREYQTAIIWNEEDPIMFGSAYSDGTFGTSLVLTDDSRFYCPQNKPCRIFVRVGDMSPAREFLVERSEFNPGVLNARSPRKLADFVRGGAPFKVECLVEGTGVKYFSFDPTKPQKPLP